jgi:uncharacterized protein
MAPFSEGIYWSPRLHTMPRVIHFEISSNQPDELADFYSNVFGWVITKKQTQDYWLIRTGRADEKGINGGMAAPKTGQMGIIPTIDVESVDSYLEKVEKYGGKIIQKKFTVPGTGYVAYCADPDGNVITVLQYDSQAK